MYELKFFSQFMGEWLLAPCSWGVCVCVCVCVCVWLSLAHSGCCYSDNPFSFWCSLICLLSGGLAVLFRVHLRTCCLDYMSWSIPLFFFFFVCFFCFFCFFFSPVDSCGGPWNLLGQQSDNHLQAGRQFSPTWLSSQCWFKLPVSDPEWFILGISKCSTIWRKLFW